MKHGIVADCTYSSIVGGGQSLLCFMPETLFPFVLADQQYQPIQFSIIKQGMGAHPFKATNSAPVDSLFLKKGVGVFSAYPRYDISFNINSTFDLTRSGY